VNGVFSENTLTIAGSLGSASSFVLGARRPNEYNDAGTFAAHDLAVWNEVRYTEDFTPPTEPLA
jgi:hypothetical protein